MHGVYKECRKGGDKEVTGMLIGRPCVWNGKHYILIKDFFPLAVDSSQVHVTVLPESIAEAMAKVSSQYPEDLVIGWYHSHPGYGLFLSDTDLFTQRLIFREWFNVALVVDHLRNEHGFFALTPEGGYYRMSHIVWRKT